MRIGDRLLYTKEDENCMIDDNRKSITNYINEHKIQKDIPIIKEFLEGNFI